MRAARIATPRAAPLLGRTRSPPLPRAPRSFTISDAALQRLLAPSGKSRGSSNQPLVDELAHIARERLSAADVLRLRDQLTAILEVHSGAPAAAVTAVRASRCFEAQLKAQKPVSVRDLCLALPMWPFAVQSHFLRQLLRLANLPFLAEPPAPGGMPLPAPDGKPPPPFGSAAAAASAPSHEVFDGLEGSMLRPLGLALPALRNHGAKRGDLPPPPAPPVSRGGDGPPTSPRRRGSTSTSTCEKARSPRLAVMARG